MRLFISLPLLVVCFTVAATSPVPRRVSLLKHPGLTNRGPLDQKLYDEIKSYQAVADQTIDYSLNGAGANQSYNRLAEFTDKFGNRVAGSKNLENSIDYMLKTLQEDGLENVHGEKVNVTHWLRNTEYAQLIEPRVYNISISGLGRSVGTPAGGITADVVVVRSFDELKTRSAQISGKIVVYNQDYEGYPTSATYRVLGAANAAKYGAVATLIRSVTPFSIHSVHTGVQYYPANVTQIPTACITVEDAEMFDRMQQRGWPIKIHLYMGAQNLKPVISRNTVAEVVGSVYPEQVVVVSGHLDSWDVGQGAMDDGGGAFVSWQALSTIKHLGLRPKRTLRLVMWTDEENGGVGSMQYFQQHKVNASNYNILFESDMGVFTPTGIQFTGSAKAKAVVTQIGQLVKSINASSVSDDGSETDTAYWSQIGVPTATLANKNDKYFYFHHTDGDTISVLDPVEMNLCSALWSVFAYVLADMETMLPRE